MILIALGANKAGPWGEPAPALARALRRLDRRSVKILRRSALYRTDPLGPSDQPVYVNAVASIASAMPPGPLLALLHEVEAEAGRRRGRRWYERELDLDLLAWHGCVVGWPGGRRPESGLAPAPRRGLVLPHPGLDRRPFVAIPLAEVAPGWHHPVTGETAWHMARRLGGGAHGRVLSVLDDGEWDRAPGAAGLAPPSFKP